MQLGAAMLHVNWLEGRTQGDWQFGVKLLCGRFPHIHICICMCVCVYRHINASLFGLRVNHSATIQYMRVDGHATLNFNNSMPTVDVCLILSRPLIQQGILAYYVNCLN
jgi:hypothetical protein